MEEDTRLRRDLIAMIDERLNTSPAGDPLSLWAKCGAVTQNLHRADTLVRGAEDEGNATAPEPYFYGDHLVALVNGTTSHAIVASTPWPSRTQGYFRRTKVIYQRENAVRLGNPMQWLGRPEEDHDQPLPPLFVVRESDRLSNRDVWVCALRMLVADNNIPDAEWDDMDFATFCSTGRVVPLDKRPEAHDAFLQAARSTSQSPTETSPDFTIGI